MAKSVIGFTSYPISSILNRTFRNQVVSILASVAPVFECARLSPDLDYNKNYANNQMIKPRVDNAAESFAHEFLSVYLRFGLGTMSKTDLDALVMALLDQYGFDESGAMAKLSNQTVSERLRTPVMKVKKLRYAAALRFGGNVEEQAKARLLATLANAVLEPNEDKILLIVEDSLVQNWLQGQLKKHQQIFDHSFNTEIVKVSATGLFDVLRTIFGDDQLAQFEAGYAEMKRTADHAKHLAIFRTLTKEFALSAAKAAGAGTVALVKMHLGLPH